MRTGIGYDIHRLEDGRKLVLGGVHIPFEKGLLGHSDGDALLHAITDAMLGALALGDLGNHFPDDDPNYKNADSMILMKEVYASVSNMGFQIVNIDANIIAQTPKMAPYIFAMRQRIAKSLNIEVGRISIKARSNEGLGELGNGLAIATQAVVVVEKSKGV
jgi:2-C-methyl-D-erythritol 2,4-cyclodiphosphate synthase